MTATSGTGCSTGDTLRGLERNDILQGSIGDDSLYGDEGDDELTGADGNDKLYGGPDNDVLLAGIGSDLLVGDKGNDELYSGPGDDVLIGGKSADYFDCSDGYDTIIDFEPLKGDTKAENCEVSLTHNSKDIEFLCDRGSLISSTITRSASSTISISNNTIAGGSGVNMSSGISGVTCSALEQDESISLFSSSSSSTSNNKFIHTTNYRALTRK
jgi:hypothetical protein